MTTHRLRPITPAQRRRILKRDSYTCQYCFELATECDHITPYSYIPDNTDANLVASCRLCNSLAGSMVFDSFNMKYQYIKREREKRARPYNPAWYVEAVKAMMDAETEAPEPVEVVKPPKVKIVKPPKPPKPKVEKPPKVVKPPKEIVIRLPFESPGWRAVTADDLPKLMGYFGPAKIIPTMVDGRAGYYIQIPIENFPKQAR